MTSEATHGKRTDAVANHIRILEAARAVLIERGLDMEVNEVADRASVGVGTLYRHFGSRDEMVRAVLERIFEDLLARLRAAAEIGDPSASLRQIPLTLAADQALFAVLHDPRCSKVLGDVKKMSQPLAEEVIDLVAGIVERGMRSGAFRGDLDPPATAASILGSIAAVMENQGARRPLSELAGLLADLHEHMVARTDH